MNPPIPTISGTPAVWVVCDAVDSPHWPIDKSCENKREVAAPRELVAALA